MRTADGRRLGDVLDAWPAWTDDRVIRPLENPVAAGEALAVLRGSLAPNGAVLKRAAANGPLLQHEGTALVFEGLDDLAARIDDPSLPVTPETVLVLRGAGPIGAGMPEAGSIPIPAKLARAGVKDMVRISDARMSGTAYGTVILHVSPEAAAGGPLALVRDGDRIRLDTANRRLDLLVDDAELERRRDVYRPPPVPARGYARLHATHVLQADRGCDLDFLVVRDDLQRTVVSDAIAWDAHAHVIGDPREFPLSPGRSYTPAARVARRLPRDARSTWHRARRPRAAERLRQRPSVPARRARPIGRAGSGALPCRLLTRPRRISRRMHERGIRGVRCNLINPGGLSPAAVTAWQPALRAMGWHVEFHLAVDQLDGWTEVVQSFDIPVVVDHMGRPTPGQSIRSRRRSRSSSASSVPDAVS